MKKIVIMPGGFHPFHAGHKALYDAAVAAFPSADVYVAATADTSTRPFPFEVKQKLAKLAGIPAHRFIQVKSPFRANEITQHYDPDTTQLIFVRSEKDRDEQPKPGGVKKDGTASYLQPYKRNGLQPMSRYAYMAYLPVVQFGNGMTSATEIRAKWPTMTPEQKKALVNSLYPQTEGNDKLADVTIKLIDAGMGSVQENLQGPAFGSGAGALNPGTPMPNGPDKEVEEATLVNDPDEGHQIRPDGGFGTWTEATLVSSLARDLAGILELLKGKNYTGADYKLYDKHSTVQAKLAALAKYQKFMDKQGRRPIARGREIDLGENSDYLDEVNWKKALATGALAGAAALGSMSPAQARVSIGPDGQMTPSFAQQMQQTPNVKPSDDTSSSAELPGKDLPSAEKVNRDGSNIIVTYNGNDYTAVMLDKDGPQPRLGPGTIQIKIPMAMMGIRGLGNYIGKVHGNKIYITK